MLRRTIGPGSALDMLLTARRFDAAAAAACGIYQRVVDPGDLDSEVQTLVTAIASAELDAVRAMKRLVYGSGDEFDAALRRAVDEQVPLIARPAFARRVSDLLASLNDRGASRA
ncbi:MAG: enoyl-CoA hydratase/isomerase family protein [Mycobacteriales bacterium]